MRRTNQTDDEEGERNLVHYKGEVRVKKQVAYQEKTDDADFPTSTEL
jgi:hypothetical protein